MELIYDEFRGEVIDGDTGLVVEERVPDFHLDVNITISNGKVNPVTDILGSMVSDERLNTLNSRVTYWGNKTHFIVRDLLGRALCYLGFYDEPKDVLIERALYTFRRLAPVLRGLYNASFKALAIVSLLIELSNVRFPITSVEKVELMELSGVKPSTVRSVEKRVFQLYGVAPKTPPPTAYLRRFCSEAGIPHQKCLEAEKLVRERRFSGLAECVAVKALQAVHPNLPQHLLDLCRRKKVSHDTKRRTPRPATSARRRS